MRKTKTLSKAAQKKILNCNVRREIVLYLKSHQSCADSREVIEWVSTKVNTTKKRIAGNISALTIAYNTTGIIVHKPHKQSDLFLISNMANNCASQI